MLATGGQTPTMKNPPFVGPHPVWDIPSIFTTAEAGGVSWAAFPDQGGYPTKFYASLNVDPRWHSHACIPKTIIDLLGLLAIGVAPGGHLPPPSRGSRPNLVKSIVRRACLRCDLPPVGASAPAPFSDRDAGQRCVADRQQWVLHHQDLPLPPSTPKSVIGGCGPSRLLIVRKNIA